MGRFQNDILKAYKMDCYLKVFKLFNGIHSADLKPQIRLTLGKGVSKETKSALGTYVKYQISRIKYSNKFVIITVKLLRNKQMN